MDSPVFHRIWRVAAVTLLVIASLFVALVIYRIPAKFERDKTEKAVAKIHATHIEMRDVTGENLPPAPSEAERDATVAGVDANQNGIRDDVELAIFKLHPDSVPPERSGSSTPPKSSGSPTQIRAAELQYALALQMELTQVFNSETLIAAIQEEERGTSCITATAPKVDLSDKPEVMKAAFAIRDTRVKEVEDIVINNEIRKRRQEEVSKYLTSYGDKEGPSCDINLADLPN